VTNKVRALGYLGLTTNDLPEWRELAGPLLGAQSVERDDDAIDIRLDRREWRVRVSQAEGNDLQFAGWEVADDRELDALASDLAAAGYDFSDASEAQRADRGVQRQEPTRTGTAWSCFTPPP
jgi:hypothetical protein